MQSRIHTCFIHTELEKHAGVPSRALDAARAPHHLMAQRSHATEFLSPRRLSQLAAKTL